MARMPGAEWVGEHGSRSMSLYDIVCIHTIVGYAPAHAAHFSTSGGGRLSQSRDTRYRSAANLNGNHRVIAIENEDHGSAFNGMARGREGLPALTAKQVTRCAEVLAWAHVTHGVPLQLCPDSRPGSRGLAYHRQGIDGNFSSYRHPGRKQGGEVWTSAFGKVCPTDARIDQLPEILRQAKALVAAADSPRKNPAMNNVETAHQFLAEADRSVGKALGTLAKVERRRTVVWTQRTALVLVQRALRAVRTRLPKS